MFLSLKSYPTLNNYALPAMSIQLCLIWKESPPQSYLTQIGRQWHGWANRQRNWKTLSDRIKPIQVKKKCYMSL